MTDPSPLIDKDCPVNHSILLNEFDINQEIVIACNMVWSTWVKVLGSWVVLNGECMTTLIL